MTPFERRLAVLAFAVAVMAIVTAGVGAAVVADSDSHRRIVRQLASEYGATERGFYGAGPLSSLAVALIRPAGVTRLKFTVLKDVQPTSAQDDFNQLIRTAVNSKWQPLAMHSAPQREEWTYVYTQTAGTDLRLLVVNRTRSDAFIVELRVNPERLNAFLDDPRILGIRVGESYDGNWLRGSRSLE